MFIVKLLFFILEIMFWCVVLNVEMMRVVWELMYVMVGIVVYGIYLFFKIF